MKSKNILIGVVIGIVLILVVFRHLPKATQDALSQPKPQLPVLVTFRQALMGGGAVAQFKNNGTGELPLVVKFTSPTFNKTATFNVVINPGATKEIGHLEGWAVASGDLVEVSSDGFETERVKLQ